MTKHTLIFCSTIFAILLLIALIPRFIGPLLLIAGIYFASNLTAVHWNLIVAYFDKGIEYVTDKFRK